MSLLIERAGALASLQDGGRMGVRHLGVTQGGPVDWISHSWANWLLGNPVQAATVEITLGNFSLRAQANTCLAICGADLGAALDNDECYLLVKAMRTLGITYIEHQARI